MYLIPNSAPVNNRKFNLVGLGCGCRTPQLALVPTRLRGFQPNRVQRSRGMRGLGDTTAAVPAGSRLTYTIQFSNSFWNSISSTLAAVANNLSSQWNIQVTGTTDNSKLLSFNGQVVMGIQVGSDYGAVSDVQSILDGAFYNAAGAAKISSSIALTSLGGGVGAPVTVIGDPNAIPPAPNPNAPFDLGTWLTTNWMYVAAGLAAAVVAHEVL
jgi:hypothetical protein